MRFCRKFFLSLTFLSCSISAFSDSAWTYGVSETEGWYDFNKSWNGDTNLCWAASASNIINWWQDYSAYTSYAASGTPSGSEVWSTFTSSFTDSGGNPYYAYEWYFLGTYTPYTYSRYPNYRNWSMPTNTTNIGGGYYTSADLSLNMLTNSTLSSYSSYYYYFSSFIVSSLNSGYGLSLSISNLGGTTYEAGIVGHALTMWGCDYTTDSEGNISITTLYITDSDDHFSGLQTVSCYGSTPTNEEMEQFCFSSAYYNSATQNAYGDFYITGIVGLNLLEAIPEPATAILIFAGVFPLALKRKRRC